MHVLPVDCRIQTRGISLVSRCRCCSSPQTESLVHLFIHFEIALAVWKCFGEILRIPYRFSSITQALSTWMAPVTNSSQYGMCRASVAAYITLEIWVARCAATFEGTPMKARSICLTVFRRVQLLNLIHIPKQNSAPIQVSLLAIMGINQAKIRHKPGRWCKWDKPSPGWFKLNVDGSAIAGVITGGGVVRDWEGRFIFGFSVYYGNGTNSLAEFLALKDGLNMCREFSLDQVVIESDSELVVKEMKARKISNWRLEYPLRECLLLFPNNFRISHGFRRRNQVADRLAAVS